MASFSNMDIEEAKRRVREMQSRAESYVPHEKNNQNSVNTEKRIFLLLCPRRMKSRMKINRMNMMKRTAHISLFLFFLCFYPMKGQTISCFLRCFICCCKIFYKITAKMQEAAFIINSIKYGNNCYDMI